MKTLLMRGGGSVSLPVPERANYAFAGWYYDAELESIVDENDPQIGGDVTFYAGWRLLTGNVTDNGDGTYTTKGSTAALAGTGDKLYGEVTMEISFSKGASGGVGIMFRASNTADNAIEKGQNYLAVQILPASGKLQVCKVESSFAHLTGSAGALTTLPTAWQEKYNAAGEGDTITVVLKVIFEPDKFYAYIDGDLAYTSAEADAELIAGFTGTGYGLRSSTTPATYSITYRDFIRVEYVEDGSVAAVEYCAAGTALRTVDDSPLYRDDDGYYRMQFVGWYTQEEGGEVVTEICSDCTVYARFERIAVSAPVVEVTFNVDGESTAQTVTVGDTVVFPDDPTKVNYAFTGWFDKDGQEVSADMQFTEDTVLYAGWRLLTGNVTDNGDGTYTTKGSTAALAGTGDKLYGEVTMEISFSKGASGGVGIMFRASNTADNAIEKGQNYLAVTIIPASGKLQVCKVESSFAHLTGSAGALTTLPTAWQEKYNAAGEGDTITVVLKVIFEPDKFYAYIDGDLAYTSAEADAELIAGFTGTGYGLRSSTTPATYSITYRDNDEAENVSTINDTDKEEEV